MKTFFSTDKWDDCVRNYIAYRLIASGSTAHWAQRRRIEAAAAYLKEHNEFLKVYN